MNPPTLPVLAAGLIPLCGFVQAAISPAVAAADGPVTVPARHQVWNHTEPLDTDWRFIAADSGPMISTVPGAPAVPEDQWQKVTLPHTWNAEDTMRSPDYRLGVSWYRRHLEVPAAFITSGGRRFVRFGAASQRAQVFVNGQLAGEHAGGYSAFTVEIGPLLVAGDNLLEVRVDNREDKHLPPTTDGLFNLYGGLYRSVQLIDAPRIGFARAHLGGPGVRVWSEQVGEASADLQVEALVDDASESENPDDFTVRAELSDSGGRIVASASQRARARTRLTLPEVRAPELWSPEHPVLYTVTVTLLRGGEEADRATVRHGFRSFRFSADKGFFLNGQPYKLRGVNRHQDYAGFGNTVILFVRIDCMWLWGKALWARQTGRFAVSYG